MQCVVLTELHNAPRAFDAELSRKKERLIEFVKTLPPEMLAQIKRVLDDYEIKSQSQL